jgi:hypothetical protein
LTNNRIIKAFRIPGTFKEKNFHFIHFILDFFLIDHYNLFMVNLLADSTYFLASALKYPSTMNFSGIVPKLHNVNKNNAFPVSCINKNELNGPGSGISIMGGLYSHLLYVHTDGILYWTSSQRGWQPHPIHGQPDGVLYWASSQILFFFACFFIPSIKRIGSW